jgi:sulfite exporter TauE/SafE
MIGLFAAIAASSLAGSLHCAAMCGPLIELSGARSLRLALIHALGRLTTYASLGALAGLLGGALDLAGHLAAIQHVAAIAAGVAIVVWGVRGIAVARGWLSAGSATGGAAFSRGLAQLRGRGGGGRGARGGGRTGPRPCGWLWAFVVSAAGTAHPATGAAVMAVFWLGTVPAMTGALALGGAALSRIRHRMPVISACVLIALGLATLATRWSTAGTPGTDSSATSTSHCHGRAP